MPSWLLYTLIAVLLYGVVGLFQKMATNRISASASVVCCCVGFLIPVPYLFATSDPINSSIVFVVIAFLVGVASQIGSWFLFASLENGAKASVAVSLTALYPLVTVLLATTFLAERLTRLQWLGVFLALVAGAMISYETSDTTETAGSLPRPEAEKECP